MKNPIIRRFNQSVNIQILSASKGFFSTPFKNEMHITLRNLMAKEHYNQIDELFLCKKIHYNNVTTEEVIARLQARYIALKVENQADKKTALCELETILLKHHSVPSLRSDTTLTK